ncbi:MAG TPA: cytochrome c [Oligoflexus sp.]|uniref:c-type cytochrome n=1 Tax=Oligoflexus sp. TaxID=1971216 RepID=UPI002D5B8C46|nr:cytochrome c [Oligoflexus sp.]HYX31715.1 cytochrome c [Oligoflexus sp.]
MRAELLIVVFGYVAAACGPLIGQQSRVEPKAPIPVVRPVASQDNAISLDGKGLYEKLCASCHGTLSLSTAARASFDAIQNALLDIPNMQSLPELNDEQVNSIVSALSKIPPGKGRSKP